MPKPVTFIFLFNYLIDLYMDMFKFKCTSHFMDNLKILWFLLILLVKYNGIKANLRWFNGWTIKYTRIQKSRLMTNQNKLHGERLILNASFKIYFCDYLQIITWKWYYCLLIINFPLFGENTSITIRIITKPTRWIMWNLC